MDLRELEQSEVLSITLDRAHLYFETVVRNSNGIRYKLSAWNPAGIGLNAAFGALHVQANRTDVAGRDTLGELESVSFVGDVLTLEGDFGDVVISGVTISIEELT
jgi:hypothetical protein